MRVVDEPLHEDARRVHVIGIDLADLHDLLGLGDADAARGRGHRIEVARRLAIDEVAGLVGLPGLDERHIRVQRALHHVLLAVELARLLALRDERAVARGSEERRNARAARAQLLGERALRRELELELAGQVLPLELLVLADVGGDHLADLARLEQEPQAEAVDAGVVRDHREVLLAAIAQREDQRLGDAAQAEAADGQRLAVLDDVRERRLGGREELVHTGLRTPGPADAGGSATAGRQFKRHCGANSSRTPRGARPAWPPMISHLPSAEAREWSPEL